VAPEGHQIGLEAGLIEDVLDLRRRNVVLDDEDQDLIAMTIQELPDHAEFLIQRVRSELAQGVAEVRAG
jgi:hypothetical protein